MTFKLFTNDIKLTSLRHAIVFQVCKYIEHHKSNTHISSVHVCCICWHTSPTQTCTWTSGEDVAYTIPCQPSLMLRNGNWNIFFKLLDKQNEKNSWNSIRYVWNKESSLHTAINQPIPKVNAAKYWSKWNFSVSLTAVKVEMLFVTSDQGLCKLILLGPLVLYMRMIMSK